MGDGPANEFRLLRAAAHVKNARKGRLCQHLLDPDSIKLCWVHTKPYFITPVAITHDVSDTIPGYQLYHSQGARFLRYANATIYMMISFIELPPWANESGAYPIFAPLRHLKLT